MDSNFSQNFEEDDLPQSLADENNIVFDENSVAQYEKEIALLKRQLSRSDAAKIEAETLLESKSRRLSIMDIQLRQKEEELIRRVDQTSQYLVNAQLLANVATFHIDENIRFVGSSNFSKIVGSKSNITNIRQLRSMVHPRDVDDIDAILKTAMKGGLLGRALEHDVRVKDDFGRVRWLRWSAEQKYNGENDIINCFGAVRDITIERRAERHEKTLLALSERRYKQLQRMSGQLSDRVKAMEMLSNALREAREVAVRANKSKSRFLAMMSHDIRTPMNAILATLELLSLSHLDDEQKRHLELAQNSGDQLLFLLADIIEYARTDGWVFDIISQPISVHSFLDNAADTWKQLAYKKDLEIEAIIGVKCPKYIKTDPTRVRQLLDNLISNAIKYTDRGKITINADIDTHDDRDRMRISVTDTGSGISEAVQSSLFDDLERGDHQDDFEIQGSGLGLSICRRIVRALNGEIGVESEINKGSTFWIELPVTIISEKDYLNAQNDIDMIRPLSVNGNRPMLLVAEDVAANRMVVTSMLEKLGCDYEIAMDGRQAVELVQLRDFDAILMDISMPRLNGMEATKIIREQGKNIPILAVTAFVADDEKEAIINSGMNDLISKPISLASLHYALNNSFDTIVENDLNLYMNGDNGPHDDRGSVPDFDIVEYIDIGKLRHQMNSVPADMRDKLQSAIIDDLRSWFRRFQLAWQESDKQEISTAAHALTGICNGFGAHKLLRSLKDVRESEIYGNSTKLIEVVEIYEHTLVAFQNSNKKLERRIN